MGEDVKSRTQSTERKVEKMKKILAAALTAIMLVGTVSCADVAPISAGAQNDDVAVISGRTENDEMSSMITVTEVGENYIVGTTDEELQLRLNISMDTAIVDSISGSALAVSDIKVGETVQACYSQNMTRSIPAHTKAYLIVRNADKGAVNLITVDKIESDKDGNVLVTDNKREMIVRILKNAQISPYKTKNLVRLEDIKAGDTILAWYDIVMLSLPGQANTERVVIFKTSADYPSAWAKEDVDSAFSAGIAENLSSAWREDISRLDFCTLVYNALDKSKGMMQKKLSENPFDDVESDKVNALKFAGIVNGKSEKIFAPDDKITREEAAAVVFRAAKYAEVAENADADVNYKDSSLISDWAKESVIGLAQLGIMKGTDKGTFEPRANYTSEQAVVTALRLYNLIKA